MKTLLKLAILDCLVLLFASSCKEELQQMQDAPVQFSIAVEDLSETGRLESLEDVRAIVINVKLTTGETILDMKEIALYDFKGKFVSAPVSIRPGHYMISDFLVLNNKNKVAYATPKEGSERAYLVDDPLPIGFDVVENETNEINVEVISANEADPVLLGYTSYGVDFVETFKIGVNAFVYNEDTQSLEATDAQIQIGNVAGWVYEGVLKGTNNIIELKSSFFRTRPIEIKITKPGYYAFQQRFLTIRFEDPLDPLNVTLMKDDSFKFLFTSPEDNYISQMIIPSRTPHRLLFITDLGLYKVDINDLDNPGEPEYINNLTGRLSEDFSGTLYLGDFYSTDNGESWKKIEQVIPTYNFVEFKGAIYGVGTEGIYKETGAGGWEKLPLGRGKIVVHNNRLFTNTGRLVTDNGVDFMSIPKGELAAVDIFDIAGKLILWNYEGGNDRLLQFNGTDWTTSREIFHYIADPLGIAVKKYNQYILLFKDKQFSVIDVANDCNDDSNCVESYMMNFRWDYGYARGIYAGGDKFFVVAPDNRGRFYVYGMELGFLN